MTGAMTGLKARKCKHCGESFKPTSSRHIYCKAKKCSRERRYKYWLAYIQEWKKRRPTYYADYLRNWRARNPSYWKDWKKKKISAGTRRGIASEGSGL